MEGLRYTISEAGEKLNIEPHVLRYWEEELELKIPRNEMGHRYYTPEELTLFENIKRLKEQGLQLRAIKMALLNLSESEDQYTLTVEENSQKFNHDINIADPSNEKVKQFQKIMKHMFINALEEYGDEFKEELKLDIRKEISEELQDAMMQREEMEKQRYQRLDQALREIQQMRQEIAATQEKNKKPWYQFLRK